MPSGFLSNILPPAMHRSVRSLYHRILPFHRNGWRTQWRRVRDLNRILKTDSVSTPPHVPGGVALCVMCYQGDWQAALWAIKSFYLHAGLNLPLLLRLQGEMDPSTVSEIRKHLPTAKLISQQEADSSVERHLRESGCSRLIELRRRVPHIQKLTDFAPFAQADSLLVLDSDILFFRHPETLAAAVARPGALVFQQDWASSYVLSDAECRKHFGFALIERLNVGLMLFPKKDLAFGRCEEWLSDPVFDPHRNTPHIEQTLWALLASKRGDVELLPPDYVLTLEGRLEDPGQATARHYVTPVRGLFFDEGIRYLLQQDFSRQIQESPLFLRSHQDLIGKA